MNDQWIWLWVRCLRENKDYRAFCEAKRASDSAVVAALARQHSSIAEVYADFGDVYFPMLSPTRKGFSKQWHGWLDAHRYLFYPTTVTVGPKTTMTEPKYRLALERAGARQMKTIRKYLTVYVTMGPRTGKPVRKHVMSTGKVEQITTSYFIKLATQQRHNLWKNGQDWDDWSAWLASEENHNQRNYKPMLMKMKENAEAVIANTVKGLFPVT